MNWRMLLAISLFGAICSCGRPPDQVREQSMTRSITSARTLSPILLEHDFGELDADRSFNAAVEVTNDTNFPLIFKGSRTTCGCLSLTSIPEHIDPGMTEAIQVTLNTLGRKGRQHSRAWFWETVPSAPIVVLEATALVRSCWIDPEYVSFGDVTIGSQAEQTLKVVAAGYPNAEITSVASDADWVVVSRDPQLSDNRSSGTRSIGSISLRFNGQRASPGALRANVDITIQTDKELTLSVPVAGFLSGNASASPSRIIFGRISDSSIVRSCTLAFVQPLNTERVEISTEHPYIEVESIKWSDERDTLSISLRAAPPRSTASGLIKGNVIGTDGSGTILFRVPYVGVLMQ